MTPPPSSRAVFDSRVRRIAFASCCAASLFVERSVSAQGPRDATPPVVVSHVDAVYPPSALAARRHADVTLTVTVDADGRVSKVDVVESGGSDLDEAAIVAVRQWTFVAAKRAGAPIASRIRVPFHFAPPAPPPEEVAPPSPPEPTLGTSPAVAPAPTPPPAKAAPAQPPEEVLVIGRTQTPSRGASDFNIRIGQLSRVPRKNASELLTLAPGILLTNEGGEGHAEQVFLRGFDAREGQDIEFSVGGVPINEAGNLHGNGYADTHFIINELVTRIRVLEGPFDPRQGNFAVAGSADYELGLERRGLTAKYTTGSWGTQRALLLWGPKAESTGTFGGVEVSSTDGFGKNRDAKRGSAILQYEGRLGTSGSYRLTGQAYTTTYHSAGVLRDDDYKAGRVGFFDTYDPNQGGDSSRYSISADVESKPEKNSVYRGQVFVISRSMRLRENFTGFFLDRQEILQNPHGQRGDLLDLQVNELTIGTRGSARYQTELFGEKQEIEFGLFARGDRSSGVQYRIENATNAPFKKETDLDATLGDIGLFADASFRPLSFVTFRGGVRADIFTYNTLDNCAVQTVAHPSKTNPPGDQSCLSQGEFGRYREPTLRSSATGSAFLPRATVLLGPAAGLTWSASYGRGVRSIDPIYVTQDTKTPFASITAYEGGAAFAGSVGELNELVVRSVFFRTHVDRDLLFSESAGRNTLANGTTRTGWVGAARFTSPWFDEAANITLVRSEFDDTHLVVPYVPDVVVRSDTAAHHDLPVSPGGRPVVGAVGAGVTYIGRRPLPYGQRSDTIFTLDASATFSWRAYEIGLIATNLLDNRYRLGEYNYSSNFHTQPEATLVPVRHFTAGAPRGIFASFSITLGDEG